MKIYDCFMYFDEDLLLDIRMNILNQYIDKFVIIESTFLHSGKKKKKNFDINNFNKFKDKIIYILLDEEPKGIEKTFDIDNIKENNRIILDNSLKRENYQRNMLLKGILNADENDLILSSDLDEIPNLENFIYKKKITIFCQKVYYYKFNLQQPNFIWYGTRACKKKYLKSFQWLRNIKSKNYPFWRLDCIFSEKKYQDINFITNGGWHFTSIKKPDKIFYKLSNFMHHLEFELSGLQIEDMNRLIKDKKILYDHSVDKRAQKYKSEISLEKTSDVELPNYITKNKKKFLEWFD